MATTCRTTCSIPSLRAPAIVLSLTIEYHGAPRQRPGRHSKLPFVVSIQHAAEITHILNLVLVHENGTSKHDGKGPSLV
jgi:hypothetical protein